MRKAPPYQLLDACRGIASLWVVVCHACVPFVGSHLEYASIPFYAVSVKGQLGVVLFFVISGYCIVGAAHGALAAGKTVTKYAFERFRRIYPPYFASGALAVLMGALLVFAQKHHLVPPSNHTAAHQGIWYWVANLTITQREMHQPTVLNVYWTLCYEVVFYVIVGCLLWAALRIARKKGADTGLSPLFAGVALCTYLSLGWLLLAPWECPFPLDRWYQFGLGGLLFLSIAQRDEPREGKFAWLADTRLHLIAASVLTLCLACAKPLSMGVNGLTEESVLDQPSSRLQSVVCLVFVGLLWGLRRHEQRIAHSRAMRPLMLLGAMSYSLYLVHTLVQNYVDALGRRMGFDGPLYWITFLVQILVSLAAGWLFYLGVERRFISSDARKRLKQELAPPCSPSAEHSMV